MQAVNKHEWIVIIDLKNAYVRIPIIVEHRQFLHFHISIVWVDPEPLQKPRFVSG